MHNQDAASAPAPAPTNSRLGTAVESVVEFFEGLGGCVAILAGAAAIVHYRNVVMPFWPAGAEIFGRLLLASSLVLAILVACNWFVKHTRHINGRIAQLAVAVLLVLTTAFFVIAGGFAAFRSP